MKFYSMMAKNILENSFPENLMIEFPENAEKHICVVFCNLGPIVLLQKIKTLVESALILVKVAGWPATSLKLTLLFKCF